MWCDAMWCNVMYCNVMYAYFLILLHHWHILPGLTIHIAQNIGTPARWAQARGPGRRTRVTICRNSCRNEPRLFPSSWYEITQKMYGSNEPGFLGWYLKPKSWGEGNTKSYQRNIDLMWFVVSQAIRFFFQALLWYPFVCALIEPTKMRSEAPGCTYSTRSTTNHWIERQSNNR